MPTSTPLTVISADGSATLTIVVTLTGTTDEPDAKDDTCTAFISDEDHAFTTGNVLACDSDPDASLRPRRRRPNSCNAEPGGDGNVGGSTLLGNMLGVGARPGGVDGPHRGAGDSVSNSALSILGSAQNGGDKTGSTRLGDKLGAGA